MNEWMNEWMNDSLFHLGFDEVGKTSSDNMLISRENEKKSLAVWFPAYLLYLPGNLKS